MLFSTKTLCLAFLSVAAASPAVKGLKKKPQKTFLSLKQKKARLAKLHWGGTPGKVYAQVSASHPKAPKKAALVFMDAHIVEGGEGWALWSGGSTSVNLKKGLECATGAGCPPPVRASRTAVWIHGEPGKHRYLVDCFVRTYSGNAKDGFTPAAGTVEVVVGDTLQTNTVPAKGGNVLFPVETDGFKWFGANVQARQSWSLHGCQIRHFDL